MNAFLLTRQWHDTPQGITLELWCTSQCANDTQHSLPVRLLITQQEAVFFVRQKDLNRIALAINKNSYRVGTKVFKNAQNAEVIPLYFLSYRTARDCEARLNQLNIAVWEADIRPPERYLMERFITGGLTIQGSYKKQSNYLEYHNPKISAALFTPQLRSLSVDIETSMDAKTLYSIAVYNQEVQHVFMVDAQAPNHNYAQKSTTNNLHLYSSERACLQGFFNFIEHYNPDTLIGWNFIQFDLHVLNTLCKKNKLRLTIGRAKQPVKWREDKSNNRYYITIPGRLALDGIELLKSATYNFSSFKLEDVGQQILGEGKLIKTEPHNGQQRGQAITTLYNTNKPQLAKYNLQDCKLVWDIFIKTKLFEFAIGPIIGGATENWFAYVLALVFLVFRPQGLFGDKIIERV